MYQRYFLELAYNGLNYFGWQRQKNNITVQEEIERAMSILLREKVSTLGCGRTDTGVHAKQYFLHFDALEIPHNFLHKLNSLLPHDIVVYSLYNVGASAHARFHALSRTYNYYITQQRDPFLYGYSSYQYIKLDIGKMNKASEYLMQYTDFEAFSKGRTDVKTFICQIKQAFWEQDGPVLVFTIEANRFLRSMVRLITGTMNDIGRGKFPPEHIIKVIESRDNNLAGRAMPPQGLFLTGIKYPEGYMNLVETIKHL